MSSERDFHYNPILDGMFRPWVWILNISSKKKNQTVPLIPPFPFRKATVTTAVRT